VILIEDKVSKEGHTFGIISDGSGIQSSFSNFYWSIRRKEKKIKLFIGTERGGIYSISISKHHVEMYFVNFIFIFQTPYNINPIFQSYD
jgi:hypothetical protein